MTTHLDDLRCPKCPAMNRPGATLIDREQDGSYTCRVCSENWRDKAIKGDR